MSKFIRLYLNTNNGGYYEELSATNLFSKIYNFEKTDFVYDSSSGEVYTLKEGTEQPVRYVSENGKYCRYTGIKIVEIG